MRSIAIETSGMWPNNYTQALTGPLSPRKSPEIIPFAVWPRTLDGIEIPIAGTRTKSTIRPSLLASTVLSRFEMKIGDAPILGAGDAEVKRARSR
jgi:hypothetical protein